MSAPPLAIRDGVLLARPSELITWYRENVRRGPDYYTRGRPPDEQSRRQLVFGDLAWAVLLEGRPSSRAAQSFLEATPRDLSDVPSGPLNQLGPTHRASVVDAILELVKLDGFRSSLATKVLHPKRPATVPVLDNSAIFGSFMVRSFLPGDRPSTRSASTRNEVNEALEAIHYALELGDSQPSWQALESEFGVYERVELFDMLWWSVIRAELVKTEAGWTLSS